MAGGNVSVRWREVSVRESLKRTALDSLRTDILDNLVRTPFVVVCALWIVCLPVMYFALYGDLIASVGTLAQMTAIFIVFLMTFLVTVVTICLVVSCIVHVFRRARWRKVDTWN